MGSDRRKIFDGCNFTLDLGRMPYLKKKDLREKILQKGGTVVYSVNKKTDFVVIHSIPEDESIWPFSLITATKFGVKIVYPSYIDSCLESGKLEQDGINPHLGNHVANAFSQGRILGFNGKCSEKLERRKQMDKSSPTTVWKFMDPNGPSFHSANYEIAKFVILKGHRRSPGEVPFCSLEIHIKVTESDNDSVNSPKFCVFWHVGVLSSAKKDGNGSKNCRYTDSSDSALSIFNKLFTTYTNPPYNFTKGHPQCPADVAVGSPKLQEIWDEQNVDIGQLDDDVGDLMTHIWKEAVGDVTNHIAWPVKITENEVGMAEAILRLLRTAVKMNCGEEYFDDHVIKLVEKFSQLIPLRFQQLLFIESGIAQVFEMLQLIRDVIAVTESASSGQKLDHITQYKALRCFVQHHPTDTEEFANVNRIVVESSKVPIIVRNVYTVRRNVENVDFTHGLGKKQLLFHGSEARNVVGILSRGLILPSQFTTVRGDDRSDVGQLGQGIYFSPSASTSANYSKPSKGKGTRFLLLAEVALGEIYQTRDPGDWVSPPDGYNSVHGVGANDMEPSAFEEDEFVIFNVSQQRLKYLIEFNLPSDDEVKILEKEDDDNSSTLTKVSETKTATSSNDIMEKILYPEPKVAPVVGLYSGGFAFPLKDLKISARLIDLAGQVCIFQLYENPHERPMEAKYAFPLDDLAAVCGFEAYINDKHIVGKVKEKKEARREYVKAIAEGHGAYLMDEERPNIFVVSVGNLPPKAKVLIKITYVTELNVERGQILFHLPGNVSVQQHKIELSKANQNIESVFGESKSNMVFSIVAYIEMPFDITAISCPTHYIHTKKTATKAMVKVAEGSQLGEGFQLLIMLSKMHVPRMWVEESSRDDMPEACMLTFYPNFDVEDAVDSIMIIFIDASHSMSGNNCRTAQQIALLCLRHLPNDCKFNIVIFGTAYSELFIAPQMKTQETEHKAQEFIMQADGNWGNSELLRATLSTFLLPPETKKLQNMFVISDGFLSNVGGILRNAERFRGDTRIFTFGVGSTCNSHLLKTLAVKGAGACEIFEKTTMSTWEKKVKCQISKAMRPVLTDVRVEWQQMNNLTFTQAPKQLVSLFSGERQVVYGFVPNCTMATLKANLNGMEISTVVSASHVEKTSGEILHRLTARAIIRDYEYGNLDDDCVTHEVQKQELDELVLDLSKKFNLVTLRTSFIAVERRDEGELSHGKGPSIDELFTAEAEDALAYISYEGNHQVPCDEGKDDKDAFATETLIMTRMACSRSRLLQSFEADDVLSDISGDVCDGVSRDDDIDDDDRSATETSEPESDDNGRVRGRSDGPYYHIELSKERRVLRGEGGPPAGSNFESEVPIGSAHEDISRSPTYQSKDDDDDDDDDASATETSETESDENMGFGLFDWDYHTKPVKKKRAGPVMYGGGYGVNPSASSNLVSGVQLQSMIAQIPKSPTNQTTAPIEERIVDEEVTSAAKVLGTDTDAVEQTEGLLLMQKSKEHISPAPISTDGAPVSFGSVSADTMRTAFRTEPPSMQSAPRPYMSPSSTQFGLQPFASLFGQAPQLLTNSFGFGSAAQAPFKRVEPASFFAVSPHSTGNFASSAPDSSSLFGQQAPQQPMASTTFGFSPQSARPPSPVPLFPDVSYEEMRVAAARTDERSPARDVIDGIASDSVPDGAQTGGTATSLFGSPRQRRPPPLPPANRRAASFSGHHLQQWSLAPSRDYYALPPPPPIRQRHCRPHKLTSAGASISSSEWNYAYEPNSDMEVEETSDDGKQESSLDIFKLISAGTVGNSLGGIPFCTEILKQLAAGLDISHGLRQNILQVQNLDYSKDALTKLIKQIEDVHGKDAYREDFKFDTNLQTGSWKLKEDYPDYNRYATCLEEIVLALKRDGLNSLGSEAAAVIVDLITTILCFALMVISNEEVSEEKFSSLDLTSVKSAANIISQPILKGGSMHKWWVDILKGLVFVNWANRRHPLAYQSLGLCGNWEMLIDKCMEMYIMREEEMSC